MILIKNAYIKPMVGEDIENGSILLLYGASAIPMSVFIDAEGRLVTPGCVEAHCHIGLHNEAVGWEGRDYNESIDPITPQMRAIDSIYPQDEAFGNAIRGGVTSACTGPGSANVIGGQFVAMKTFGKSVDEMAFKEPAALKCALGENPKNVYGNSKRTPQTRMATAAILRQAFIDAENYRNEMFSDKPPKRSLKNEILVKALNKEIPVKFHAHRADDIMTAIRIAKEFDLSSGST